MMQWQSMADFFAMGGRGFYVWGSYGVSAVLVVAELWLLRQRRRSSLARLSSLQQLEPESRS